MIPVIPDNFPPIRRIRSGESCHMGGREGET